MPELQFAIQRARVDALREAQQAVADIPEAATALASLVTEAEEAVNTGMFPVGSTIGYVDYSGKVVAHTPDTYPGGVGYILDNDVWVNAVSEYVVPFYLKDGDDS